MPGAGSPGVDPPGHSREPDSPEPDCVGVLVRDARHRVFVHRRTPDRRLLPGIWDIVGGHREAGETPEQAAARELAEETGWRLRRIEAVVADWEWEAGGVVRSERDYLVEVDGDLTAPRLEPGKHDTYDWVGPDRLELLMAGRTDGDRRLRDVVAKATRIRLTERLRLEPVGPEHAGDLWRLHADDGVAYWFGGTRSRAESAAAAARMARGWETDGVHRWMAYGRGDGALVGRGGAYHTLLGARSVLALGWAVRSGAWGRGYATEIGRAALAYAFGELGADEVVAFTERHNRRSRAVMERLGMRYLREETRRGLVEGLDGVQEEAPFAVYTIAAGNPVPAPAGPGRPAPSRS